MLPFSINNPWKKNTFLLTKTAQNPKCRFYKNYDFKKLYVEMHSHLKASRRKYYWSKIMYAHATHTNTGINLTTKVNIRKNNKSTEKKNDTTYRLSSFLNFLITFTCCQKS